MDQLALLAVRAALVKAGGLGDLVGRVARPIGRAVTGLFGRATGPQALSRNLASGRSFEASFPEFVAPYYAKTPGGYSGAVRAAESARTLHPTPSYQPLSFTERSLARPVPVDSRVPPAGVTSYGQFDPATGRATMHPWNIGPNAGQGRPGLARSTLEHELTHARVQDLQPGVPISEDSLLAGQSRTGAPFADTPRQAAYRRYASSAVEIDPRLAQVKRLYAQQTGRLVDTPEEADRALRWYNQAGHATDPNSEASTFRHVYTNQPMPALTDWWHEATRRMTQLVGVGGGAAGLAAAGRSKEAGFGDAARRLFAAGKSLFERPAVVGERAARAEAFGPSFKQHLWKLQSHAADVSADVSDTQGRLRAWAFANPSLRQDRSPVWADLQASLRSHAEAQRAIDEAQAEARATFAGRSQALAGRHAAVQTGVAAGAAGGALYGADQTFGDKIRGLFGRRQEGQPS
jgi:hypothetical protein